MRNSTAFWGLLIAAVFIYGLVVATAPAEAAPRIPYPERVDKCWNLSGVQDPGGRSYVWRFKFRTPERGDCFRIARIQRA